MTGLAEILIATTPPGSGVVISPPVYGPFFFRLGFTGPVVVVAPLLALAVGSYDLDLDALDEALGRPGVSAYVLCSPHNPLGQVWSPQQLTAVADLCQRHGVTVIVDEIHAPLVLPGATFTPFGAIDHEMAERAWILTSASKGWNIAGLKCGVAVVGCRPNADVLTERWESLLASNLGVLASVAAF